MPHSSGQSPTPLAAQVHAIVGGTPAYRREFVQDDAPVGESDFDDWVVRTVLNPQTPLLEEARRGDRDPGSIALPHRAVRGRDGATRHRAARLADLDHAAALLSEPARFKWAPDS
jgi:uncharacterized protein